MTSEDRDELVVELLSKIVLRLDRMEDDLGTASKAVRTKGLDSDTLDAVAGRMRQTIDPALEQSVMRAMYETTRQSNADILSTIDTELSGVRRAAFVFSERQSRWGRMDWSILGLTSLASLLAGALLVAFLVIRSDGLKFERKLNLLPAYASLVCRTAGGQIHTSEQGDRVCWYRMPPE